MPRVNKTSNWKPVAVNSAYLQSTGGDSIISLQELTDYTVLSDGTIQEIQELTGNGEKEADETVEMKKKPIKKKKPQKKKTAKINDVTSPGKEETEADGTVTTKKKPKKKKNPQQKKTNDVTSPKESLDSTPSEQPQQKQNGKQKSQNVQKIDEEQTSEPTEQKTRKQRQKKKGRTVSQNDAVVDINQDMLDESEGLPKPPLALKRKCEDDDSEPQAKKKKKKKKKKKPNKNQRGQKVEEEKTTPTENDMSAWMNLFVPEEVMKALGEQNFVQPTPIQMESLPSAIRDRRDIVGAAHTGSGKTLAFAIPILNGIMKLKEAAKNELNREDDEDEEIADEEGMEEDGDEEDEEAGEVIDLRLPLVEIPSDEENDDGEEMDLPPDEEDEEGEELEGDQVGCVRTVHNVTFDWLEKDEPELSEEAFKPLYALILTPTRELAIQVKNHIEAAAKYTGIRCMAIVGGMSVQKQERLLRKGPEIVVATPGRLWELYSEMSNHLSKMPEIRFLVLDEADRMVEKGHFEELEKILGTINSDAENEKRRQTFVFSATLTYTHKAPERLFMRKKKKKLKVTELTTDKKLEVLMGQVGMREGPKIIDLTEKQRTAETLTEARINCSAKERDLYLYYLLQQYPQRTLVFCNSKDCIRRLISIFTLLKCCPLPLHADMQQRQRLKNLDRFTGNPRGLLLATDVAARGLDIPGVEQVVHYQVPRTTESYVHRSGRTARASKEGLSVMMVAPDDLQSYRKIIKSLNRDADLPIFPVESDFVASLKPRLSMAWSIDLEEHKVSKHKRENNWFEKQAKEMDIELDEDLLNDLGDSFEQARMKEKLYSMRANLDDLLHEPVIRAKQSGKYLTQTGKLNLPYMMSDKSAADTVKKSMKNKVNGSKKMKKEEDSNEEMEEEDKQMGKKRKRKVDDE